MTTRTAIAKALISKTDVEMKRIAWHNAKIVDWRDTSIRMDCDGRLMRWSEYGSHSEFGWQIDHIIPTILGGPDVPGNVRARHYLGNARAGGILGNLLANMRQ